MNRGHPLAIGSNEILKSAGKLGESDAEMLRILEAANEDPGGFNAIFRYVLGTAVLEYFDTTKTAPNE